MRGAIVEVSFRLARAICRKDGGGAHAAGQKVRESRRLQVRRKSFTATFERKRASLSREARGRRAFFADDRRSEFPGEFQRLLHPRRPLRRLGKSSNRRALASGINNDVDCCRQVRSVWRWTMFKGAAQGDIREGESCSRLPAYEIDGDGRCPRQAIARIPPDWRGLRIRPPSATLKLNRVQRGRGRRKIRANGMPTGRGCR